MHVHCLSWVVRTLQLGLWVALAGAGTAGARTLAEVRASHELRICVAGSSAAFYQANGEAFARHLGVPAVVTRLKAWDDQFKNREGLLLREARYLARPIESGQCDLLPNDLHLLDWRLSKMDLVPHYTVRKMIVAHRSLRGTVHTPADLAGLRAAVQKGTAYDTWLSAENATTYSARPVQIAHHPTLESVQRVAQGLADFTVTGSEGAFKWIRSGDFDNLDLLFPVDEIVSVGWGIAPYAADLREELQRYFDDSVRIGSDLDRAWQRYYGISRTEYHFFERSLDTRAAELAALRAWALPVGSGCAGVLAAMALWTGRLRREARSHRQTAERLARSQQALEEEAERRHLVSHLQLALQATTTRETCAQTLLSALARHMDFQQALLCGVEDGRLSTLARYADTGDTSGAPPGHRSELGTLLEAVRQSREPMVVAPRDGFGLRILSSAGGLVPAAVLIQPVVLNDEVVGLLELAALAPLSENDRAILEDLMPFVAVALGRLPTQQARQAGGSAATAAPAAPAARG